MWILLFVMFQGQPEVAYFETEEACEVALKKATSHGHGKGIKVASCISSIPEDISEDNTEDTAAWI